MRTREAAAAVSAGSASSRRHSPSPASSRCMWVVSSGSSSEVYGGKAVASNSCALVVAASKGPAPEGSSFQRVGPGPCGYSAGRQAPTGMGAR